MQDNRTHKDPLVLLLPRIKVDPETDCWNYTGSIAPNGYGRAAILVRKGKYRTMAVHRFVYERTLGSIPEGHELHHLCHNRACCNPRHLEPLTRLEHVAREPRSKKKTHCKRGHEFTPENTRISGGLRTCRACHRMHSNNHYAKKIADAIETEAT